MRYKMINSFHNTSRYTTYSPDEQERIDRDIMQGTASAAERRARQRSKRALCCSDARCTCSDSWGYRG